jgi:DNA-binding LacI/PurR family transcriptional regulator
VIRLVDVAKAAGVSRGTASNVFNNPELVRAKLRQKVEAAARELGYLGPDPKGRLLRAGKFNAIGVMPPSDWGVADSLRNPVFDLFLLGVGEACDEIGANLVIVPGRTGNGGVKTALVDGFIFGRVEHLAEVELARLRRLPFAAVDFDPGPSISSVHVDARAGCYAAAKHLTEHGHRRFGILSFLRSSGSARVHPSGQRRSPEAAGIPTDQEKFNGYADAFSEARLDINDVPMVQADPWDRDAARMMLDAAPDATAILSMSVMQASALVIAGMTPVLVICSLTHGNEVRAVSGVAPRQHQCGNKAAPTACQLRPVTHHRVPPPFNDKRGVRIAQADDHFCDRHFLLRHRSVNGKSWIEAKEADLVRDAAKSLDAERSPSG